MVSRPPLPILPRRSTSPPRRGAASGSTETKIVLITDAAYLAKPAVRDALERLDASNGEIWAKLDAGTDEYFQLVDRPNVSLEHVLENILDAARRRPVVIQSLFMRVNGEPVPDAEVLAYCARLNELRAGGGALKSVQLYTIARTPAEAAATALRRRRARSDRGRRPRARSGRRRDVLRHHVVWRRM